MEKGLMMAEKLLPCPFCGAGTTEVIGSGIETYAGIMTYWKVAHCCDSDVEEYGPPITVERIGRNREQAISRWNMRDGKEAAE
jgi:wobble nucleotide-excising tRNase